MGHGETFGISLGETASSENFEQLSRLKWRKVPYEQQMDMG